MRPPSISLYPPRSPAQPLSSHSAFPGARARGLSGAKTRPGRVAARRIEAGAARQSRSIQGIDSPHTHPSITALIMRAKRFPPFSFLTPNGVRPRIEPDGSADGDGRPSGEFASAQGPGKGIDTGNRKPALFKCAGTPFPGLDRPDPKLASFRTGRTPGPDRRPNQQEPATYSGFHLRIFMYCGKTSGLKIDLFAKSRRHSWIPSVMEGCGWIDFMISATPLS